MVLGAVLILERSAPLIDHLSPTFLFLAVGATGLLGGVASFVVGPEDELDAGTGLALGAGKKGRGSLRTPSPTTGTDNQWMGRPVPNVVSATAVKPVAPTVTSPPPWSEDATAAEIPPSLHFDPGTYARSSPWRSGRLLHLSEDGALRVYTVEDALQDLEFVSDVVHAKKTRDGTIASPTSKGASP